MSNCMAEFRWAQSLFEHSWAPVSTVFTHYADLSLICSQSQSLVGEGGWTMKKCGWAGESSAQNSQDGHAFWECIFGVLKWGMQWKSLGGKVLDSVGFWTFHTSRIASHGQDNYTPSKFQPSLLISFPDFDFRDWERVADRRGIASVNLRHEIITSPIVAVIA